MKEISIEKISSDVLRVIEESKATFFVKEDVEVPTDEALYELKATISNNVGMYFYNLKDKAGK